MAVMTIRGQLGSGAQEIGRLVADRIHADYVDREIIAAVAARLRWPERDIAEKEMPPGSLLGRIAEALGRAGVYEGAYLPAQQMSLDDTHYLTGLESVIRELAESQSIVILGRGSQFILREYPGIIHVLVVAPLEVRVERVMEALKRDEQSVKQEIGRFDNSHREFARRYFNAELEDPLYYDLVVNTQHLSFEAASSIIVGALPFTDRSRGGQDRTV
jgi:cytidylate kinase